MVGSRKSPVVKGNEVACSLAVKNVCNTDCWIGSTVGATLLLERYIKSHFARQTARWHLETSQQSVLHKFLTVREHANSLPFTTGLLRDLVDQCVFNRKICDIMNYLKFNFQHKQ